MSEKHTPGPWFVDTDGDQTIDTHWGVVSKHNDLWVAACYRSGTTPRDEKSPEADAEAKANAALIARAPTLAAEVERLRAEAASFHMDYRMKCDEETKRLAVEVERLREENANLRTVMVAAAEEIHAHWDAHCDSEGYGPANLMRRLEEGVPTEYGYTAGQFAELQAESAAERRKVEALREALRFYAQREHFALSDANAWDTVSGEPQNYWCDDAGTATVEDGATARAALASTEGGAK